MRTRAPGRVGKLLRTALLVTASAYLLTYLVVAILRIQYPFELEWMEGGVVDHIRRILAGKPLYVRPSPQFVPFIYTPLYFYLSALVSRILGVGFLPLRLVSFASSIGCLAVIWLLVKRQTSSHFPGILAAGLFAATYPLSDGWFDIARVDSLFLLLLLLAIYMLGPGRTPRSWIAGGVLIWLSFLTKQTALLSSLPIMLSCFLQDRRRSLLLIAAAGVPIWGSNWLLDRIHDGWYGYYVFELPAGPPIVTELLAEFWTKDLLPPLWAACLLSAFYLWHELARGNRAAGGLYLAVAAGLLGGAWVGRLHAGGHENVLLPAYAAIAILFGLAAGTALKLIRAAAPDRRALLEIGLYALCLLQFALLVYHPSRLVPTRDDLEAGREFIATIAAVEGEVFIPDHGYLPALAGKRTHAHGMAVFDVARGDAGPIWQQLSLQIGQAVQQRRFAAIVMDTGRPTGDVEPYYLRQQKMFAREDVFWPVTGLKKRPEFIYVPKPRPAAADN
ncbi:MAG: glycosyltransferase family 39 protein [Armatimonadota bacterium]|nr:MAG: glycosyltransferase family 39 protein [Armatimonadota bacterium]